MLQKLRCESGLFYKWKPAKFTDNEREILRQAIREMADELYEISKKNMIFGPTKERHICNL